MDIEGSEQNPYSFAKPEEARVTNVKFHLKVDFQRNILSGDVILLIKHISQAKEIILDVYELVIKKVTNDSNNLPLIYDIGLPGPFGRPFTIQLPKPDIAQESSIRITYETSPHSPALYWLTKEQTVNNTYPFLVSDNKLIYARSMFPCQDTPSVKFTYYAEISVRKSFTALMSANILTVLPTEGGFLRYTFIQNNKIPAYAVTIAVGFLQKQRLSKKSDIFAEQFLIKACLETFYSDTIKNILLAARKLFGRYTWGRCDICVLPLSVAHLEINCPCVIFISPLYLGIDQSVIVQPLTLSISQSWAGHLVTCKNFNHLWLNKSFSTFISRKIVQKTLNCYEIKSSMRNIALNSMIKMFGNLEITSLLKCLLPNLTDVSPDDAIQYVPYEWGCTLLEDLEITLGGPSVFEPFLKSYFKKFANKSISTKIWKNYLYQYFSNKKNLLDDFDWDTYLYSTDSIPKVQVVPTTPWERQFYDVVEECSKLEEDNIPLYLTQQNELCDAERMLLLKYLDSFHTDLTVEKLTAIEGHYQFYKENDLIRYNWLLLCMKIGWLKYTKAALKFALTYYSPNYACPIFEKVVEWPEMHDKISMYNEKKGKMLYETQRQINLIIDRTKHLSRLDST